MEVNNFKIVLIDVTFYHNHLFEVLMKIKKKSEYNRTGG